MSTTDDERYPNADDLRHERGDHSTCGEESDCYQKPATLRGRYGLTPTPPPGYLSPRPYGPIVTTALPEQDHQAQAEPITGEANTFVEHTIVGSVHPNVIELMAGDTLIVPMGGNASYAVNPATDRALSQLMADHDLARVIVSTTATAPFVLRKAEQ